MMDTNGNIRELMTPEELELQKKKFKEMFKNNPDGEKLIAGKMVELERAANPFDNEIPIDKLPDPSCKDCYGRGQITRILENIRKVEPCHCVKDKSNTP